jgi:hypothetical protein
MAVDMELMGRLDEMDADPASKLRESMWKATRRDPDREAQVQSLSSANQLPPDTVDRNFDEVKRNQSLKQINIDDLFKKHPTTAQYMTDESNAAISVDDLDILKRIEENGRGRGVGGTVADLLGAFGSGVLQVPGMAAKGTGELIEAGGRTLERAVGTVLPEGVTKAIGSVDVPIPLPGESLKTAGGNIMRSAAQLGPKPEDQNLATDIAGGLGQVSAQIVASIFAPQAAIPLMFTSGVEQQAARQEATGTKGSSVEADQALLMGGAVTAITEQLGIDRLLKRLPKGAQEAVQKRLVDVMMAGGGEAVQEVSEGIAQGLIEKASTNPEAEIFEGLGREALAAGGTGAIVRSIVQLATKGRGGRSVDAAENVVTSAQDHDRLDQAISLAQESKTRGRAANRFSDFLSSTYGDQQVFIDPEALQAAIDAGTVVPESILAQSSDSGTALAVPMRDFLSNPDFAAALKDDVRMSPEGFTRKELQSGAGQEAIKALLDRANNEVEIKTEADEIFDTFQSQLVETGRVRAAEANQLATLIPSYATVKARALGIPVKEVMAKMGVTIIGPVTAPVQPEAMAPKRTGAQDFAGVKLTQERTLEDTGKKVKITEDAQVVWDQTTKRQSMITELRGCLGA